MLTDRIKEAYDELSLLIDSENRVELNCGRYLGFVNHVLISGVSIDEEYCVKEYRCHSGSVDYIVSSRMFDDTGVPVSKAYIWELKAPQCYVFELDDNTERVRPTPDLVKAENQLVNYYDEVKNTNSFLEEFNITHPENVKIGGVIIGSPKTYVKQVGEPKKTKLFNRGRRIRERYFYSASNIRLCTWEFVLIAMQGLMNQVVHLGERLDSPGSGLL